MEITGSHSRGQRTIRRALISRYVAAERARSIDVPGQVGCGGSRCRRTDGAAAGELRCRGTQFDVGVDILPRWRDDARAAASTAAMSMLKQSLWTVVLVTAAAALTGCATDDANDGGGGGGGTGSPAPTRVSCTANVAPTTFTYEVGDAGRMLTVQAGQADEQTLERVGAASDEIYGAWLVRETMNNGAAVHFELRVAPGQVSAFARCSALGKTAMATATSPATVTSTTVTILQSDTDVEYSN